MQRPISDNVSGNCVKIVPIEASGQAKMLSFPLSITFQSKDSKLLLLDRSWWVVMHADISEGSQALVKAASWSCPVQPQAASVSSAALFIHSFHK
jgi:hypothetical protein